MLRYQVPEEISLLLAQYAQKESITLDLGCGSGVMAQHLLPYSKHLTGVDLSPNMLAEATKKNLYHKLVEEDCITFIAKTTDSNLIIAADLLPYLMTQHHYFL